jgi:hypothetical protein
MAEVRDEAERVERPAVDASAEERERGMARQSLSSLPATTDELSSASMDRQRHPGKHDHADAPGSDKV